MVERENLVYRANKYRYNFENFRTINTFGRGIPNDSVTLKEADKDQSGLLVEILNFNKLVKPKKQEKKQKKKDVFENLYHIFKGRGRFLKAFDIKTFQIKIEGTDFSEKVSDHSNLKMLILNKCFKDYQDLWHK